tara:strand:+ start:506 stop:682 length:177 start_codon:yes stop_codon:yes gene_type:complete
MFKLEGGRVSEDSVFVQEASEGILSLTELPSQVSQSLSGETPLGPCLSLTRSQIKAVN